MGFEILTQPQIFLTPITATQGIVGLNEAYPLLTSRQSWITSSDVDATVFPIPGTWTMLQDPASFIVTVGGVLQAPNNYTINSSNRRLTFVETVSSGLEICVTQLATNAPSTAYFDSISATNVLYNNLTVANINTQTLNSYYLTAVNLITVNLTALSAVIDNLDIRIRELSGFVVNGNILVTQNLTANNIIALSSFNAVSENIFSNFKFLSSENAVTTNLTANNLFAGSLTANRIFNTSGLYNSLSTTNLSALNFYLNNIYGKDIIADITTLVFPQTGTKVGIGTNTPNKALTVIGSISTTELNASTVYADTLEFTTAFGPFIPEYFCLASDSPLGVVGTSAYSIFNEELPILLPNKRYLLDYYISYGFNMSSGTNTTITWNLSTIPQKDPAWSVFGGNIMHSPQVPTSSPTLFVAPLSTNQNTQVCLQPYTIDQNPSRHFWKASLIIALTSSDVDAREIDLGMRMGSANVTSFVVHRGSYWKLTRIS